MDWPRFTRPRTLSRSTALLLLILVVALGFDTYEGYPNGGFIGIGVESFQAIGGDIAALGLPTLLVQEGGYNLDALGRCAGKFFDGLAG